MKFRRCDNLKQKYQFYRILIPALFLKCQKRENENKKLCKLCADLQHDLYGHTGLSLPVEAALDLPLKSAFHLKIFGPKSVNTDQQSLYWTTSRDGNK